MLLAHSAMPAQGISAQNYSAHIRGVVKCASKAADDASSYALHNKELLRKIVPLAAEFHDLGKLDKENQDVLSGRTNSRSLPIQHTDAGTAFLLDKLQAAPGAVLIRSHHIGLPDFIEEQNREEKHVLRDDDVMARVNQALPELVELHYEALGIEGKSVGVAENAVTGDPSLFFRIALSCLADADHSDTAIHYQNQTTDEPDVALRPSDRLASLDRYVKSIETDDERSVQRSEVYSACRNSDVRASIASCDSPVGTGKTTAVMAHLLSQAQKRGHRRIIVVLPFTNIITQSVQAYRKAIVLPGENPDLVVAELHHRADYQDIQCRQFTSLWKAPIIVTTAVNFFETLSSNTPATLRRLHNLPGSAVFIDESHAALPAKLLPLAWRWIKALASEWGCYWILASGSLNRFWKIEEFDKGRPDVPEIMPIQLRDRLSVYEKKRITYRYNKQFLGTRDLVEWVAALPGPRIVILNTVQSAAVIAREYKRCFTRSSVEHLSTALTPSDRDRTLSRIKSRLADKNDKEWTLFATSCVEAGVDLSFKTGVREAASLVSLLQTAGRVNRHDHINAETVWTIVTKNEGLLKKNPSMSDSSKVLLELISAGNAINPELCTTALKREIRLAGGFSKTLMNLEKNLRFPHVEREFQVIASDTRTVVVGDDLIGKLENHRPVDWRDIQKSSVQIWGYCLDDLRISQVIGHPKIYKWTYAYDDFIGYMAGILPVEAFKQSIGSVCVI